MMFDHPAWLTGDDGRVRRAVRLDGETWSVVCTPDAGGTGHVVHVDAPAGHDTAALQFDVVDPIDLKAPDAIADPLREGGPVTRLRNPDVWDTLGTAIVRQIIRAGTARKQYRAFCEAHGERHETSAGPTWLFPAPDVVLGLPDDAFQQLGMAIKVRALRAAAEWVTKYGDEWAALSPEDFVTAVQRTPQIGPWSAHASVADRTNRYDLYPFADLAVRKWAGTLAPSITWPEEPREFGEMWQGMAGAQLSEWTLLTLAWGVRHANGGAAV